MTGYAAQHTPLSETTVAFLDQIKARLAGATGYNACNSQYGYEVDATFLIRVCAPNPSASNERRTPEESVSCIDSICRVFRMLVKFDSKSIEEANIDWVVRQLNKVIEGMSPLTLETPERTVDLRYVL